MLGYHFSVGEVYTVACSPIDATLVATGGGDDKGFMWKIGRGDFAQELSGVCMILQIVTFIFRFTFHFQNQKCSPSLPWQVTRILCLA